MQVSANIGLADVIGFHTKSLLKEIPLKRALVVLFILIAMYFWRLRNVTGLSHRIFMFVVTIIGFVACAAFVYLLLLIMIVSRARENGEVGHLSYWIEQDSLKIEVDETQSAYAWSDVGNAGKSSTTIWLHLNNNQYRLIPRKAFMTDQDYEQCWEKILEYRNTP